MSIVLNGNYSAKKNQTILVEGQEAQSLNILLQGKVDVYLSPFEKVSDIKQENILKNSYKLFSLSGNTFLGPNDLFISGKYSFSYVASEDSNVFSYAAQNREQLETLLNTQKDYAAYIVNSTTLLISNAFSSLSKVNGLIRSLSVLTDNLITFYWSIKEFFGFPCTPSGKFFREGWNIIEKLNEKGVELPREYDPDFFEQDHSELFDIDYTSIPDISMPKLEYYRHFSTLPAELKKSFLSFNPFITAYHCEEASTLLSEIQSDLKEAFNTLESCIKKLYSEDNDCILNEYLRAALEMKKINSDIPVITRVIDYILNKVKEIWGLFESDYNHRLKIDINHINGLQNELKALEKSQFQVTPACFKNVVEVHDGTGSIPVELENSAQKILEYSRIPYDRMEYFMTNLELFRKMKDRLSSDNEAREVRKAITSVFFEVYEGVLKRVIAEKNTSRLYHMFLSFAFMDEKLLSTEHIINLYKLVDNPSSGGFCPVHTMRDWLIKIFNMEKDPSINEFGQDYFDVFRELKRRRDISEKEKIDYENDSYGRLEFEIANMFKTNHRLCYGQISIYVPILHDEMITRDLSKALITSEKISESVRKILDVDFSVFHREVSYRNPDSGIEKELIMKAVIPDFILVPIFGSRAFMWQELTGRNRSTPGRFILPLFTDENPDDLIIKLIGNFRWELCRTMMGVSWNDITQKSLTSEYMDYIQFYKKNRDLSEEAKEKIKSQIQKYHNMTRDIFTADYETWINYESKGIMRLNKVVRGILYKHCPFPREIRATLEKQPLLGDIAVQFKNTRSKYARELENHYNKLTKSGLSLDTELIENLRFYKEM
ncbi:MAG: cyclic nucleotide-binding domain-containing protein [Clostridia bacterium]|nr:cyclic nucleotide-binding domain-containing protein [Clostridia bacterium]